MSTEIKHKNFKSKEKRPPSKDFLNKKRNGSKFNYKNRTSSQSQGSSLLNNSQNLFEKARILYEKAAKDWDIEGNKGKSNEFRWISKMLEKGTFEDKINALASHVKQNPKKSLKYLDMISYHLANKNPRHFMFCLDVLKELYLTSVLENKKYKSFIDACLETKNPSDDQLIAFYIDNFIHKKYFEFIQAMENKLKEDNLLQMKKKILQTLQELLKSKPEREEYLLELLIYKLGDPKSDISNHVLVLLKNLQETHFSMSKVILIRLQGFIANYKLTNEVGCFHALVLISQFRPFKNEEYIKLGLNMFFALFNEYVELEDEKYYKYLEQIVKIISSFFKMAVSAKSFSEVSLNLYRY